MHQAAGNFKKTHVSLNFADPGPLPILLFEATPDSGAETTGVAVVGVGVSLGESFGTGVASSHSLVL